MKDNERKTEINIEVTNTYYGKNGELIAEIAAGSKLTKADAGRMASTDEDMLTLKLNGSEKTKVEVDYNGSSTGTGDDASVNKTVEVTMKEKVLDAKGEVVESMVAGSKLTKADAGRMDNEIAEDWFNFQVEDGGEGNRSHVIIRKRSKLTKPKA